MAWRWEMDMDIDKGKLQLWLHDELSKTKGVEVSNRLDWLDYCLFIFEENYKALNEYTNSTQGADAAFEMFKDHAYSSSVHGHFVRHLHNYLVSSKSLVEHTRISMRSWYKDMPLLRIYEEEVKKIFVGDPLTAFIEELRNYCVHKSPIGILTQHELAGEGPYNSTFIHKKSLLDWGSLPKLAKEYLNKFDEDIPIMDPISEYTDKVVSFRKWLRKEFEKYHAQEIYEAKWYVQALRLAEEGNYDLLFRSCGMNIPGVKNKK
jgi:hypothetical protein